MHGTVSSGYILYTYVMSLLHLTHSLPTTGVWPDISMLHVNRQTVIMFVFKSDKQSICSFHPAAVSMCLLLSGGSYWGGHFVSMVHCSIWGGEVGAVFMWMDYRLIVCWAVQRLFFMNTSWRKGKLVWAPHTHTQTNPYTHTHRNADRLKIKSVHSEACASYCETERDCKAGAQSEERGLNRK